MGSSSPASHTWELNKQGEILQGQARKAGAVY